MRYEGAIYRPPGEWKSYLLQCTIGCSHNRCTFCEAFKAKDFRIRPLAQVLEDIDMAALRYPFAETVFLCDGDAIILPMDYLLAVIGRLRRAFPRLRRITCYAGPLSTMSKTPEQLRQLCQAGLGRCYLGVETGDSALLQRVDKGVDAAGMLAAGLALRQAGLDLWVTVIAGLEGTGEEALRRNAALTAELLNRMAPEHISVMTYMPMVGTPLYEQQLAGDFVPQSEWETLMETRELLTRLQLDGVHFTANHASNHLPLKGTIARDTPHFLALLDQQLPQASRESSKLIYRRG